MDVCYAQLTKLSVKILDGGMFYFTNSATIEKLSQVLVKKLIQKRGKGKLEGEKK